MFKAILEVLGSKKFWLTVAGSGVVGGLYALNVPDSLIAIVGGLFGVNIASQGAADYAKNKNFIPSLLRK